MKRGVTLRAVGEKSLLWFKIAVLVVAGIMPALTFEKAEAAQLTSRKVTISTSEVSPGSGTDVQHVFAYTLPNTTATKAGILYDFCTTPLGTCTTPTGMAVEAATHDTGLQTGWPNNSTEFAIVGADTGDCTISSNTYRVCYSRDEGTATGTTGGAVTHTISGITAPSANQTVYVRISIYSDDDFGSGDLLDQGVVAAAYVNQLTVTGRVAERLDFCVAAIANGVDTPTSCTDVGDPFPSTTDIGMGVIGQSVTVTPVDDSATTNQANNSYGIAMVSTNASGGVSITYFPEAQTNVTSSDADQLRAFRVAPTDCSATPTSVTDQCFVSAPQAGETFDSGEERFGMYIPCIDQLHDGIVTQNLSADGDYVGTDGDETESTATGATSAESCQADEAPSNVFFAFRDDGSPDEIASSVASADGVVDSEAVKIAFGARAAATTPEGSYSVVLTYIATPTF